VEQMHSIKVFRIVFKYLCCVKTFLKSESVGVEKEQIKGNKIEMRRNVTIKHHIK
jgi:hypothetical protein